MFMSEQEVIELLVGNQCSSHQHANRLPHALTLCQYFATYLSISVKLFIFTAQSKHYTLLMTLNTTICRVNITRIHIFPSISSYFVYLIAFYICLLRIQSITGKLCAMYIDLLCCTVRYVFVHFANTLHTEDILNEICRSSILYIMYQFSERQT
jgi:hypothetical protein